MRLGGNLSYTIYIRYVNVYIVLFIIWMGNDDTLEFMLRDVKQQQHQQQHRQQQKR